MNWLSSFSKRVVMAACMSGALAGSAGAWADTVTVAENTSVAISLQSDLVALFDHTSLDGHFVFDGPGVFSGEGGAIAPVTAVTLGSQAGSLTVNWGNSVTLSVFGTDAFSATNFSLSVADKLIYVDLSFAFPDSEPQTFSHIGLFSLENLTGTLDGVALDQLSAPTSGPGLLNLSASLVVNIEASNLVSVALGGGSLPTDGSVVFPIGELAIGVSAVPEPATWATMGLGLAGLMVLNARRRRAIS
ncbi:MAG: PEP-CTERM sorting domain-containing protein [Aquabacterium sp.]|uniref:PEP-CTERM sorting domain-containing protein n=1 Tax=Aquabacterium sp. TaxID=1872578 RepID=UPI003BAFFE62